MCVWVCVCVYFFGFFIMCVFARLPSQFSLFPKRRFPVRNMLLTLKQHKIRNPFCLLWCGWVEWIFSCWLKVALILINNETQGFTFFPLYHRNGKSKLGVPVALTESLISCVCVWRSLRVYLSLLNIALHMKCMWHLSFCIDLIRVP